MEGQMAYGHATKLCYILASTLNFPWTLGMQYIQDIPQFAYSYLPTVQEAFRVKAVCVHYCQRSPSQKTRHRKCTKLGASITFAKTCCMMTQVFLHMELSWYI